mmetsp:Transcript_3627/g.4972  ORF Transcript_3627/g.4972 Transcript_3627/m.4972 type:complete len:121 (+) Transcript_3627:82-444(+)
MMFASTLLLCFVAFTAAFSPLKTFSRVTPKLSMATPGPTYWEGEAPPSSVLGVGAKIPSAVFGPLSLVAFIGGTYCLHESNILNQITVDTINPGYVLGSLGVPISWGMHVAAWIQKKNGK